MEGNALFCSVMAVCAAFAAGVGAGILLTQRNRAGGLSEAKARSVTRLLMVNTVRFAWGWVTTSYLIAVYSTVRLGVVYTLTELSTPAITVLLATILAKVGENIFEHNDGALFGRSNAKRNDDPASFSEAGDL